MAPHALPHVPRQLTAREQRDLDLWSYASPKLQRDVHVVGPLALIQGLDFEFDPDCLAFVERPRMLDVAGARVELDFWVRRRDGREQYWLLVPNDHATDATTPRRAHRHARALLEAADRAGIAVSFAFEHDLAQHHERFRVQRHLLGYVQDALQLPHRQALVDQLAAFFATAPRATIDQACAALPAFKRSDVCTVIADLLHRGALALANARELSRFSLLEWRPSHAPA
jgi:hypothetical protein